MLFSKNFWNVAIHTTSGFLASTSSTPTDPNLVNLKKVDKSGCGKTHTPGFHNGLTIQSNNHLRQYTVYVPTSYNTNTHTQRKLIFDFHGRGGTPLGQYNNSRYYQFPRGDQYLVVYPAGLRKAWEGASYAKPGVNDRLFTHDLLHHIRENYCVDSSSIYALGKSNGGGFVDLLACSDEGDEFSAFAMASTALYTDNSLEGCSKRRAILESHGDRDLTVKYDGGVGQGGTTPPIMTWIDWWGQRDGCTTKEKSQVGETGYNVTIFSCHGYTDVVKHYQVYDLGHCWPTNDGDNTDGKKKLCNQPQNWALSYTPKVLDFFKKWTSENAPKN